MIRRNAATIRTYLAHVAIVALVAAGLAAGMAYGSAARDAVCSVPISELSWIGAGECDRVAEWVAAND